MKILMVMDPGILVPPNGYGGIERIVEILALQYTEMGHEVHLLVTPGSLVKGCTVYPFGKEGFPPKKRDALKAIPTAWQFLWKHRNDFDLVHSFGRLAYLLPILNHPVKKIMSYQREITSRNVWLINKLPSRQLFFTACSADLLSRVNIASKGIWEPIYNAVTFSKYTLQPKVPDDAPLMFLGRLERIKGCHTAIEIAKATGNKLIIAGNISTIPEELEYFERDIKPFIDGRQITYVGAINDAEKNHWLGLSKALIFPIEWNEPFGIVMIEAMACGTPVIGYNRGSVNEVIDEGVTGFKVQDKAGMVLAVNQLAAINRTNCCLHAKQRFDAAVIASHYLRLADFYKRNIAIVTTGQPAANPRVMKEYQALKNAGYLVKVFYTYSADWSYKIDEEKFRSGELCKNDFELIAGNPHNDKIAYFFSRLLYKVCSKLVRAFPFFFLKEITFVRSSLFLWLYLKRYKAKIYIAHYLGALPAAVKAASIHHALVTFDAEDFHRGEEPYYPAQIEDVIQIEDRLLPGVDLVTTASPLISAAYQNLYPQQKIITINNVFSLDYLQPVAQGEQPQLKLFWFSQNIGPKRGLELIVEALNMIQEDVSLTLLGNIRNDTYTKGLLKQSKHPERVHFMQPVIPEKIFAIASQFDIGLAAEIPYCMNRDICLTNKIFTYLLAGNCILASCTAAQNGFIDANPQVGFLYPHDDAAALSAIIKELFYNRERLVACKQQASLLANTTLNWEKESGKLIEEIDRLVAVSYEI
jgi:glycosyltransferase involved in cell wall biosynthesis